MALKMPCAAGMVSQQVMNPQCRKYCELYYGTTKLTSTSISVQATAHSTPHWQPLAIIATNVLMPSTPVCLTRYFDGTYSPPPDIPLNLRYCVFLK